MVRQRYIVLDRDGVINEDSDEFIKSPGEWHPISGSLEAIALLNQHHYEVVVITNQSGIARGLFDKATLKQIHDKMNLMLTAVHGRVASIYYCPHGPESTCDCRKPKSGLFKRFSQENNVDLTSAYCIGDSLRDIQAAQAVGARPILVKTGKGESTLANNPNLNIPVFENLYHAAEYLCSIE